MEHRDTETTVWILLRQLWRQACGFPAKEEEVFGGVLDFGIVFGTCGFVSQNRPRPPWVA